MYNTIFVAWVHWVGKTTLCKKVANEFIMHIQASELIKNCTISKNKPSIDELRLQWSSIISKLKIEQQKSKTILFEWHFALYSNNGIIKVDEAVFEQIGLNKIILLNDMTEYIHSRLITRDLNVPNIQSLNLLQQAELEHANYIASRLNIELFIKNISDMEDTWLFEQLNLLNENNK